MKISASQIKTYKLCRKKWWLEKVKKMPSGRTSYGAVFGSVVHGCLERMQKGENIYPEGWSESLNEGDEDIVYQLIGMHEVIKTDKPIFVERRFDIPVYKDIRMIGYIDLFMEGHVIDHKTTSAMRWALKPKELAADDQMLIYAKYMLDLYPDVKVVKLQHNVFLRSYIPKKKTTLAYATRDAILEKWGELTRLAKSMKRDRVGPCPTVPMGDHCNAYGGCPFASVCAGTLTEGQYLSAKGKELKMADELAKKLAALEAKKRGAPKAPVQEPAPPALEPEAEADLKKVAAVVEEVIPDLKPKKKRGRPKGSRNKPAAEKPKVVGPTVRDEVSALVPRLTLYIGCAPVKKASPGLYLSLEDAFKKMLEFEGKTVEEFFASNAFDRRDQLVALAGRWLVDHPTLSVAAPVISGCTPDQKALVAALRLRADAVVEAFA